MRAKIRIDLQTGLYIESVHPDSTGDDIIDTPCLKPFYQPKWNGQEWVEGATQEYIDSLKQPISNEPTLEQKVEKHEVELATLSETMEAIFGGI